MENKQTKKSHETCFCFIVVVWNWDLPVLKFMLLNCSTNVKNRLIKWADTVCTPFWYFYVRPLLYAWRCAEHFTWTDPLNPLSNPLLALYSDLPFQIRKLRPKTVPLVKFGTSSQEILKDREMGKKQCCTSLMVRRLGLHASTSGNKGLIPALGTKIPYAIWHMLPLKKIQHK